MIAHYRVHFNSAYDIHNFNHTTQQKDLFQNLFYCFEATFFIGKGLAVLAMFPLTIHKIFKMLCVVSITDANCYVGFFGNA